MDPNVVKEIIANENVKGIGVVIIANNLVRACECGNYGDGIVNFAKTYFEDDDRGHTNTKKKIVIWCKRCDKEISPEDFDKKIQALAKKK